MNQVVEKALRGLSLLKVANIRHWTDRTFSFDCERPQGFRFRSGEFVMIGLMVDGKPLVGPIPSPRRPGTTSSSSTRSRCRTGR